MSLLEQLPHKPPFKFVDKIVEIKSGIFIHGLKFISYNEPGLEGHFPDEPIFPGVLIIEAMAQVSGLCFEGRNKGLLAAIDKAKFLSPVLPGDILSIKSSVITEIDDFVLFKTSAFVDDCLVASARVSIRYIPS
ncbi:3-hydroxyacyl-[acyl-carrier-protein] dehydratase, FabZ form [Moritella sp. JT01]|uniref:3-hydroxyacyl-ACP dehydratase FabZ n=1 Tax=Moritella sp. JT01 TaxID=756698 RepID=UPI000799192B|nr:3-hydroxyacyl-ACP dehydratase FabZ [Moritella sp. JT01]KXO12881.1 3-hydroxyacyl-[acyl-carrier-protein] dehydratase, FabZ form [Moritella sp. JT01]